MTRLDGTGDDPPISPYRTRLLDDLRKEEFDDPNTLLRSADTSLVIVTAYIPPIARKGDRLDVEVTVPRGSEAVSLKGGWLMPCRLNEHALLGGQVREGAEVVLATGPILIDGLFDNAQGTAAMRRGGEFRAAQSSLEMTAFSPSPFAATIGEFECRHISRKELVSDSTITISMEFADRWLKQRRMHISNWVFNHSTETTIPASCNAFAISHSRSHLSKSISVCRICRKRIMFGPTAEKAALQLEAEGPEGVAALKRGLTSPSPEARFRSAEALAYLGKPECVSVLQKAALEQPAFRIFALAALSCVESGESITALTELMQTESLETRYGAFRALTTLAPEDPIVQGMELEGRFKLHLVDSTATPFVHLTRKKKAEIVLFGAEQEFHLPLMVRAGSKILVRGDLINHQVEITRVAPGEETESKAVSPKLADVIRAVSELGASYPDVRSDARGSGASGEPAGRDCN